MARGIDPKRKCREMTNTERVKKQYNGVFPRESRRFFRGFVDRITGRHKAREHAFSLITRLNGNGLDDSVGRLRKAFVGFVDPVPEASDIKANWKGQGFDVNERDLAEQRTNSWWDFRKELYELADYQILMESERLNRKPDRLTKLAEKNLKREKALALEENEVLEMQTNRFMKLLSQSKLRNHPLVERSRMRVLAKELALDFAEEQRKLGALVDFKAKDRDALVIGMYNRYVERRLLPRIKTLRKSGYGERKANL